MLGGGFSLGAATAIAGSENNHGEGGTEGPVMLAATLVLLGGVLGLDRRAQAKPPRWAAAGGDSRRRPAAARRSAAVGVRREHALPA